MKSIESVFQSELEKLDESPAHPFVKCGLMSLEDIECGSNDGEVIDEMDLELQSYFGKERASVFKTKKITDCLDVEPIERMEKAKQLPDLCRETEVTVNDNEPLAEQIAQLINLMQLCQAPGT